MKIPQQAFDSGLLDIEHHERLLADLNKVSDIAGIPPRFVWSRLSEYCKGEDYKWLASMRTAETNGMVYVGKTERPIEDTMMAITGACLRNYIDARVMSVQEVIQRLKENEMPSPTVLLIPNFCLDKDGGGNLPAWQVSSLLGLLYTRLSRNLKTILYVGSMAAMHTSYGDAFTAHIEAHYLRV